MKTKFIAIAALGKERQIGLNGKVPWNFPDEYQHYLNTVKGQHVVVGRKNFEANGGDISGTRPIVLTKNQEYRAEGATVLHSREEVIQYAEDNNIEKLYVIGGAEIYELFLPVLSEFLCSVVDYEGEADTYFPEYLSYDWEVQDSQIHKDWTCYHFIKRPDY